MKTQLGFGHFPRQGLGHHSVPLLSPLSPVNVCPTAPGFHVSALHLLLPCISEDLGLVSGSSAKNPRDKISDWLDLDWMSLSWPIRLIGLWTNQISPASVECETQDQSTVFSEEVEEARPRKNGPFSQAAGCCFINRWWWKSGGLT